MPNVWIILEVRPFGLHSLMARSEAHSTEEVSACGLRYIRIYFISPYRQWTPVTRNPCAPVESPIISNLPCTFHLSLRPHLPLLFPTFPHNRPALLLTAPVSDSHFSRHCPLIALPTCYSLPPTITPSATSAYCNILRCTVRRLSLPAPSIFSSHHHPVLKSPLRSPSRGFFFFPENTKSEVLDVHRAVHWKHHAVRVTDILGRRFTVQTRAQVLKSELAWVAVLFVNLHRADCWQCEWEDGPYSTWSWLTHGRFCTLHFTVLCVLQFKALRFAFSHSLLLVTADCCLSTIRTQN